MIRAIRLKGYRGFRDYRIENLANVNLLVGRNNCGKSSVLEAVRFAASGGNPVILSRIARDRGEILMFDRDEARARRHSYVDISHFFHGHDIDFGTSFTISTDGGISLNAVIETLPDSEQRPEQKSIYFSDSDTFPEEDTPAPAFALAVVTVSPRIVDRDELPTLVPITRDGAILSDSFHYRRLVSSTLPEKSSTTIGTDSLESHAMRVLWDRILTDGREEFVVHAMRLLEPDLQDIVFLTGEGPLRSNGRAGVLVRMKNNKRRIPLGNFGEGMRRILAISLSLAQSAGAILLIDEIDTGLHWSVMEKVWRLVIRSATEFKTQIFATTHSLDCLRGLASLCERDPSLASDVSVHKIQTGLDESVSFSATDLEMALSQDIEVR